MTALTRLQGAGLLASLALASALIIGAAHLLRPAPGVLLGDLPSAPAASCDADHVPPEPVEVRSSTLLRCPEQFDGRLVRLQGEPIGDLLGRGAGRWLLLNDDDYAFAGPLTAHQQTLGTNTGIAVLLSETMPAPTMGGPGVWGDLLEVTGTFHTAAVQDQGGPAVIATAAEILRSGTRLTPIPSTAQRVVAPVLGFLALALATTAWRRDQ